MANPSLSSKQQRSIEVMLRSWTVKLTWPRLVEAVKAEFGIITTRQTLCTYIGIRKEFDNKKAKLRGTDALTHKQVTMTHMIMHERMSKLEAENAVLKEHCAKQMQMLECIFANAEEIPNLDLSQLIKARAEHS
jgi:hypothetical protein